MMIRARVREGRRLVTGDDEGDIDGGPLLEHHYGKRSQSFAWAESGKA